jgi:hypothetical protein
MWLRLLLDLAIAVGGLFLFVALVLLISVICEGVQHIAAGGHRLGAEKGGTRRRSTTRQHRPRVVWRAPVGGGPRTGGAARWRRRLRHR